MKRWFLVLLFFLAITTPAVCGQESVKVTTYYPPPQGVYQIFKLNPSSCPGSDCINCSEPGLMFYNKDTDRILYCDGATSTWQEIGDSYWSYNDINEGYAQCNDYLYTKQKRVRVGIGTSTPEFALSLDNDGGIYLKGQAWSSYSSDLGTIGSGPFFIFWPKQVAAFRVGYVDPDVVSGCPGMWNGGYIGEKSVAMGYCSNARTEYSCAIGNFAQAVDFTGTNKGKQIALGQVVEVKGAYSTGIGSRQDVDGDYSMAIGRDVNTAANYAIVIGKGIDADHPLINNTANSLMIGFNSDVPSLFATGDGNDGYVTIGGTTRPDNTYAFYVNGKAGGTDGWTIISPSDERFKKDIKPIDNALAKVMKLRGVNFQWKDPKTYSPGLKMGLVAQEVEKVVPEVVIKSGEYYSIQYGPMVALLIEAIKEQQREIEDLKIKIQARRQSKLSQQ